MIVRDCISEIKEILRISNRDDRLNRLVGLFESTNDIFSAHLSRSTMTTERRASLMLGPNTQKLIRSFNVREWIRTGHVVAKRLKKILGAAPEPSIVLYPGFGGVNGKVIHLNGNPLLVLSPDFGHWTGDNRGVLIAHEYVHYLRACFAAVKFERQTVREHLYEEGLAVYITSLVFPDTPLGSVFMSNLHRVVGRPDPEGGFVRWCGINFEKIKADAMKVLTSRKAADVERLFEGVRLDGDDTPIRTGYYLGFRMIRNAAQSTTVDELLHLQPTARDVRRMLSSS
jgi:hypothetical protein